MSMNNYSGGRSKKDTSFNSSATNITIQGLKGLNSAPIGLNPPETFYDLINFMRDEYGQWVTRAGVSQNRASLERDKQSFSDFIEFTPAGTDDSLGVILEGKRIVIHNGTTFTTLTHSIGSPPAPSEDLLTEGEAFGCAYDNKVYIVDGGDKIWTYDGTNLTNYTFPYAATYGNPVYVCQFVGRLWFATDAGYVLYTASGTDNVFEDRYLLVGTVSATSGTKNITGTNTVFQANQLEAGLTLLIDSGTTQERVTIASVSSNTAMTTAANLTNNFTNASVYLIGNEFADFLGEKDGYQIKMMKPFGQFMAISKVSDDSASMSSKLYVLRPQLAIDPVSGLPLGSALLNQTKSLANHINLHPYSFCEWNGNLIYLADNGLYMLTPSNFGDGNNLLPPIFISKDKLERHLDNLVTANRIKTRLNRITTKGLNMIALSMQYGNTKGVDKNFFGFADAENNFEFSEIRIRIDNTQGLGASSPSGHLYQFRDYVLVCGDYGNAEFYKDQYQVYDSVYLDDEYTCDDTFITCDNTDLATSDSTVIGILPIYKTFTTGCFHNDHWNRFDIHKFMVNVNESSDMYDRTYQLSLLLDGTTLYNPQTIKYSGGIETVTADDDSGNTADVDYVVDALDSADETLILDDDLIYRPFFAHVKACRKVSLRYADISTFGVLRLLNYGYSIRLTRFD